MHCAPLLCRARGTARYGAHRLVAELQPSRPHGASRARKLLIQAMPVCVSDVWPQGLPSQQEGVSNCLKCELQATGALAAPPSSKKKRPLDELLASSPGTAAAAAVWGGEVWRRMHCLPHAGRYLQPGVSQAAPHSAHAGLPGHTRQAHGCIANCGILGPQLFALTCKS
jgi:hypothetical protein